MIVFKLFKFKLKIVFMICGCADYGLPPSADGGFLWASRVIKVIVCSRVNVILINVIKIIFKKKVKSGAATQRKDVLKQEISKSFDVVSLISAYGFI